MALSTVSFYKAIITHQPSWLRMNGNRLLGGVGGGGKINPLRLNRIHFLLPTLRSRVLFVGNIVLHGYSFFIPRLHLNFFPRFQSFVPPFAASTAAAAEQRPLCPVCKTTSDRVLNYSVNRYLTTSLGNKFLNYLLLMGTFAYVSYIISRLPNLKVCHLHRVVVQLNWCQQCGIGKG